jgi:hypothetical protein
MLSVHEYERLSRAYARRYQHSKTEAYKTKALQALQDAETLIEHEIGIQYLEYEYRKHDLN